MKINTDAGIRVPAAVQNETATSGALAPKAQQQRVGDPRSALPMAPLAHTTAVATSFDTGALLQAHRAAHAPVSGTRQVFTGIGDKDAYNPTAPFSFGEGPLARELIAARVESSHSETDSEVVFFEREGAAVWRPAAGLGRLRLQDPFVTRVDGRLIVGGVRVFQKVGAKEGELDWQTVFYATQDLKNFDEVAAGPKGMKDIRLVQLKDGRVGVFTRPQGQLATSQGAPGERGSVGFTVVDSLAKLDAAVIAKATLLPRQLPKDQWWGINEAHLLASGELGVLGHVAMFDATGDRHYYPLAFRFDPMTRELHDLRLLVERSDLGALGKSKRPDLRDVLFSGGWDAKQRLLYVGAGDAEVYAVAVRDPFIEPAVARAVDLRAL